jgi:hypothetical protein
MSAFASVHRFVYLLVLDVPVTNRFNAIAGSGRFVI